jgi:inner membrane protein
MPTIFTHPAAALLKTWSPRLPMRAAVAGAIATILPDLDVIAFPLGIPYGHPFGHRGFSHSIVFALLVAMAASWLLSIPQQQRATFTFVFFCALSHSVLDAMTDGGLGIAFFAPFDNTRYFLPWTPIRVSPIGAGFFSARGMMTLHSELLYVWAPSIALSVLGFTVSRIRSRT